MVPTLQAACNKSGRTVLVFSFDPKNTPLISDKEIDVSGNRKIDPAKNRKLCEKQILKSAESTSTIRSKL